MEVVSINYSAISVFIITFYLWPCNSCYCQLLNINSLLSNGRVVWHDKLTRLSQLSDKTARLQSAIVLDPTVHISIGQSRSTKVHYIHNKDERSGREFGGKIVHDRNRNLANGIEIARGRGATELRFAQSTVGRGSLGKKPGRKENNTLSGGARVK